jgi:hypothetical protein
MMPDHGIRVLFDNPYDVDGAIATSGHVIAAAPTSLIDPRLAAPGASILRSKFAGDILALPRNNKSEDLLATLTEFTAAAIGRSIQRHILRLRGCAFFASGQNWGSTRLHRFPRSAFVAPIDRCPARIFTTSRSAKSGDDFAFGLLSFANSDDKKNHI